MDGQNVSDLRLVRPHLAYKDSFLSGLSEFDTTSEKFAWIYLGETEPLDTPEEDFESYVGRLLAARTKALPGFVRTTVYWGILGEQVVGRISFRPELNEFLKRFAGHIGFIVRPSYRTRGVASEMLRLLLQMEDAKSLGRVLLTCDEKNLASEKTIRRNGGVLESVVPHGAEPPKKRFWISLQPTVQLAEPSDAEQLTKLVTDLSAWLKTIGIAQWTNCPRPAVEKEIISKEVFVVRQGDGVIATVTLSPRPGEVWGTKKEEALYLHRLAVKRALAGQQLGRRLVQWAEAECRRHGIEILRLDCAATNPKLRSYYEGLGFQFLRIVQHETYNMDFALFEKNLARTPSK